jgi:hypothetical protein
LAFRCEGSKHRHSTRSEEVMDLSTKLKITAVIAAVIMAAL